jgi:hypothetical protein
VCFICSTAIEKKLVVSKEKKSEPAFTSTGFRNWVKGPSKFRIHEKCEFHLTACEKSRDACRTKTSIDTLLNKQVIESQRLHQQCLSYIFSAAKFLGYHAFPFRGHEHDDGAFRNFVFEMAKDSPDAILWLKRRDNFLSDTIHNEIIGQYSSEIQRKIMKTAQSSAFVGFTADGTTDISGAEQFAICLQYCNENLKPINAFVGFYNPPDAKGETLSLVIKDVFTRMMLPLAKISGFCFDTAANMSGVHKGCQAWLKDSCPSALYVPCSNHCLDLTLQEAAMESIVTATSLQFVKDASNVIRESSNRRNLYKSMFGEGEVVKNLLSLCPTRWCVRASAMKRALDNYAELKDTLVALDEDKSVRTQSRATIHGLAKQSMKAEVYVGLTVCAEIFGACEEVATALQHEELTTYGSLSAIQLLKANLNRLRNERLPDLINKGIQEAEGLGLKPPLEKRSTKTPAKLRDDMGPAIGDERPPAWLTLRISLISALDAIVTQLDERFDNPDFHLASEREAIIVACSKGEISGLSDLHRMKLPNSFNEEKLRIQLTQLVDLVESENISVRNANHLAVALGAKDSTTRRLFSEVEKLLQLILCLPCSVASSERSFSTLRRVKTWLRSTMSQSRLTHLAIMAVHRNMLPDIDTKQLMASFVGKTAERTSIFGKF